PSGPQSEGSRSKTILQNIEVLSAGQTIQKDTEGKPVQVQVVNLLVTPDQSEIMALASNDARIQLVLRNPLDKLEVKTKGTALARLFNESGPPPAPLAPARQAKRVAAPVPPPAPAPVTVTETQKITIPIVVEVIHGGKRAETKFKNEEEGKPEKTNQD
ncbi:MAG TPA: RcpC/CpaB family pilus assembly protein, partial [Bryobacteraceae bacterium]|nr:RcpC/CpaB family pilus assembly protein [Bryobacteraceae bacterium]